MYIDTYVGIYIYIYTHVYMYITMHTSLSQSLSLSTYMYMCIYIYIYIYIHTCVHICMYMHMSNTNASAKTQPGPHNPRAWNQNSVQRTTSSNEAAQEQQNNSWARNPNVRCAVSPEGRADGRSEGRKTPPVQLASCKGYALRTAMLVVAA